ncbi:MAG TPA: helix-hairpin-helix domain-containing protein [Candidatus Dormibacteraeota bacterium]|nr:helix-hairpin-helix domain-containing protein [Candidatus Dormibacteraeota bacterium]
MRRHLHLIPGWRHILLLAAPVAVGGGILVGAYFYSSSASAAAAAANTHPVPANPAVDVPPAAGLLVHVVGAVASPGLYRVPRGGRVYDAIAAAGGLSPDADLTKLPNLAGRLKDGEQVKVAFAKTTSGTAIARTNLNTATLDELETIPGFSEAFAQEVIDYRTNFGGFQNSRELVDILGMSEAEYVTTRRYLTL